MNVSYRPTRTARGHLSSPLGAGACLKGKNLKHIPGIGATFTRSLPDCLTVGIRFTVQRGVVWPRAELPVREPRLRNLPGLSPGKQSFLSVPRSLEACLWEWRPCTSKNL